MSQPTLLELSRPKTWAWVLLPFILGLLASGAPLATLIHPTVGAFILYFTLPANLLLHGVEYIHKQHGHEQADARAVWRLKWQILAVTLPFLILLVYLDPVAILMFSAFVLSGALYPRFPKVLLVVRYVLPAVFGFFLMGGSLSSLT